MFAYLKGTVEEITDGTLILDVNGIGYQISVPAMNMPGFLQTGETIKIYTYLSVREDTFQLYGFRSLDDLGIFKLLISVNGIGPKAALGILSALTVDDIRFAILSDDIKTLGKAPGIGSKTARKIILELKDKFSLDEAFEKKLKNSQADNSAQDEAVQALVSLGYSNSDALRAVRGIEISDDMDVEKILKLALKQLL